MAHEYGSIYEASLACRERLQECAAQPAQMFAEWPRKKLADFNLWAAGSGALARRHASLDERLAGKDHVHSVIVGLLSLLEALIRQWARSGNINEDSASSHSESSGSFDSEAASLDELQADVESVITQLVRISIAIRRSGAQERLDRADGSFEPGIYDELKQHLQVLVYSSTRASGLKSGPSSDLAPDSHTLSDIQERLVEANLKRRHRFLFARRRWMKQAREREVFTTDDRVKHQTEKPSDVNAASPMREEIAGMVQLQVSTPQDSVMQATAAQSVIAESSVPTAIQGPIVLPQGSQASMTAASSTSSKVTYPKPPEIMEGQNTFRCPCCLQTLPVTFARPSKWRKHLTEDLMPYSCVLSECTRPEKLYLTRRDWQRHMSEDHRDYQYWLCSACIEPARFDVEQHYVAHLTQQHSDVIFPDQIDMVVSMSTCQAPLHLEECPLCPGNATTGLEIDPEAMLSHVAEHIHSFALSSMPWPDYPAKERGYLGLEHGVVEDDFFAVSSRPNTSDQRPGSASSFEGRREHDFGDMSELDFESPPGSLSGDRTEAQVVPEINVAQPESTLDYPAPWQDSSTTSEDQIQKQSWRPAPTEKSTIPTAGSSRSTGKLFRNAKSWFSQLVYNDSFVERIVRQEIGTPDFRRFQQAWSEFDLNDTGYVRFEVFQRLMGELSGALNMCIYKPEDSVHSILEEARAKTAERQKRQMDAGFLLFPARPASKFVADVDLVALDERVSRIDVARVRERRKRLAGFYCEVKMCCNEEGYIDRYNVLAILARYCLSAEACDKMHGPKNSEIRNQRVDEEVRRQIVRGFFDTLYWSRKFKDYMSTRKLRYAERG